MLLYGGGTGGGGSNLSSLLLQNQRVSSSEPLDSLVFSVPSTSFHGSRTMVSFEESRLENWSETPFFRRLDRDENNGDDVFDEYFHQPEKKRRLTASQVKSLEKSFDEENRLEPERKVQLAKELGLEPRQVAIWFQNRRARWKTKTLEKDYEALLASYNSLKADYENRLKEKEKLKAEVLRLTENLHCEDRENEDAEIPNTKNQYAKMRKEPQNSSFIFDADRSDISQDDEDDNLRNSLSPREYEFPKIEYVDCSEPQANCGYFGFPVDDQGFGFWPC